MSKTVGGFPTAELVMSTPRELTPALASEALRLGTLGLGGALALYGLYRRDAFGLAALAIGGIAISQSRRIARSPYAARASTARAAVTILASRSELAGRLRFERLPDVFSFVAAVERDEDGLRILLDQPDGRPIVWEVVEDDGVPFEGSAWRSADGAAVPGELEIRLEDAPGDRGTEVHVRLTLGPPAGLVGAVAAGELGHGGEPGTSIADDLRRLRQLVEAGEIATASGQPRGRGKRRLPLFAEPAFAEPLVEPMVQGLGPQEGR